MTTPPRRTPEQIAERRLGGHRMTTPPRRTPEQIAERRLRDALGGVASGRRTAESAKATLAQYLLDGVKIPRKLRRSIQSL